MSKPLYILGDVHELFGNLIDTIERADIKDCTIICVGDFGIGFRESRDMELGKLSPLQLFLAERNIMLYSIRGNHDAPYYFDGPHRIVLPNIELLPDYTVKEFNGERFQLVGGGISIDRRVRVPDRSYWADEPFVYDESKAVPCDVLVTHSAPTWNGPFDKLGIQGWLDKDPTLWDDCKKERLDHDLLLAACAPKDHYCGHFHKYSIVDMNGCVSHVLDELQLFEHRKINFIFP